MFARSRFFVLAGSVIFSLVTLSAAADSATNGKLRIHVSPKQAYVFVDGSAIRDGSQTIKLPAGSHEVSVHNYGYKAVTQSVQIESDKTTDLKVDLQKYGDKVSGPFGEIELKGDPRAAVLLDGTTPDSFVGHVDEFNWNWIWHQRLLVKPGTYNVTVTREGKSIWSGPVAVKAGEQVTVYLDRDGEMKAKSWRRGETLGPQPRFQAGIVNTTVPVAPVTATLAGSLNGRLVLQFSFVACADAGQRDPHGGTFSLIRFLSANHPYSSLDALLVDQPTPLHKHPSADTQENLADGVVTTIGNSPSSVSDHSDGYGDEVGARPSTRARLVTFC